MLETRYKRSLANLKDDSASQQHHTSTSHSITFHHFSYIDTGRSTARIKQAITIQYVPLANYRIVGKKESKANRFTNLVFGSDHIKRNALQQYYSQ